MNKLKSPFVAIIALASAMPLSACDSGAGRAESETLEKVEVGPERVTIAADAAAASGIAVATATSGAIQETLSLSGKIALQPAAKAEVHAPYPGPVRAVLKNIGDNVRRGETLARVESAESLQTYAIVSPIAGVVLDRQTNVGDVTGDTAIFTVGDLSRVQAELNVVTRDAAHVKSGQSVTVTGLDGDNTVQARIATLLPTADAMSQTLIARAPLPNGTALRPGMAIRGTVVLAEQNVAIVVPNDAIQTHEGKQVVFVVSGKDTYEARPVSLGRASAASTEIIAGLKAGEAYVSKNAFLVKAELGKGAAEEE
ncbi:MAG TPA: efflux RND transporter periplasmic adaptor subunit [Caulobacterales bacterium]|nr:efflux RND transporter periplasmic adaptor subunit [Caulobacterales bacterium]